MYVGMSLFNLSLAAGAHAPIAVVSGDPLAKELGMDWHRVEALVTAARAARWLTRSRARKKPVN